MKELLFAVVCFLLFSLFSCKKDKTKADLSHFEGTFLCDVSFEYNYYPSNNYHSDYDAVIRCWVENDSLKLLNHAFPIQSEDQTVFEQSTSGNGYFKATFASSYNSISIQHSSPSSYSGPSTQGTYSGTRTTLPETTSPHPYLDELQGMYDLAIDYRNDTYSIDTNYLTNAPVSRLNNNIIVDSLQFFAPPIFHSYYHYSGSSQSNSDHTFNTRSVEWHNNSINLDYFTIQYFVWAPVPNDTIHYVISGTQ